MITVSFRTLWSVPILVKCLRGKLLAVFLPSFLLRLWQWQQRLPSAQLVPVADSGVNSDGRGQVLWRDWRPVSRSGMMNRPEVPTLSKKVSDKPAPAEPGKCIGGWQGSRIGIVSFWCWIDALQETLSKLLGDSPVAVTSLNWPKLCASMNCHLLKSYKSMNV